MHKLPVGKQRALLTRIERALRPTDPAAADAASALVLQLEPFTRGLNSREGRSSLGGSSASASFAAVGIDSYLPTGTARPAQQLRTHLDAEGAVVNFISLRNAFSWLTAPALLNALLARQADREGRGAGGAPVQIAYFNHPAFAATDVFPLLLNFLALTDVWAVNLGETQFTPEQGKLLALALGRSRVGFLFVDAVLVGAELVRELKDIIKANREKLRALGQEPWLFCSDNEPQNKIIRRCEKMWFNAKNLKRNELFEAARKAHRASLEPNGTSSKRLPSVAEAAPGLAPVVVERSSDEAASDWPVAAVAAPPPASPLAEGGGLCQVRVVLHGASTTPSKVATRGAMASAYSDGALASSSRSARFAAREARERACLSSVTSAEDLLAGGDSPRLRGKRMRVTTEGQA